MLSTIESGADVLYIEGDIERLLQIASRGFRLTSVAASAEDAERIRVAAGQSGTPIEVTLASTPRFDELADLSFDLIIAGNRREYPLTEICRETYRLLKTEGALILTGSAASHDNIIDDLTGIGFEVDDSSIVTAPSGSDQESVIRAVRPRRTKVPGVPKRAVLRTKRLYMRPWHREDLDVEDYWPDFISPMYRHYNPPRDSKEKRDVRFSKIVGLFDLRLSIFDGDGLVGYIALFNTDMNERVSEIGVNFAAHKINHGYCKESFQALCDMFFCHWGMKRLRLEVAIFNKRGVNCYKAFGFSEIRRFWNPRAPQRFFNWEQNPLLSPILQHFRHGEKGIEVEFLEMDVKRNEYLELFGLSDEFA